MPFFEILHVKHDRKMKWWYKLAPLAQIINTFYGIEKAKYTVVALLTYIPRQLL